MLDHLDRFAVIAPNRGRMGIPLVNVTALVIVVVILRVRVHLRETTTPE